MAVSTKKLSLMIISLLGMYQLSAQVLPKISKDSLLVKQTGRTSPSKQALVKPGSVNADIENQLGKILAKYICLPDQEKTWKLVRSESSDLLQQYWRSGKLQGVKAEEAYYVKMDNSTMTTSDITNHKMILIAGIAPVKPAEFIIIKVENACKGN